MHRVVGLIMTCLFLISFAIGCAENPATGGRVLKLISREEEIALGNEAAPKFEEEFGGLVDNQQLQDYVSGIGNRVAGPAEREMPYEFGLLKSEVPNAFALPGGKVYVTAGLLELMDNERQLAAVLGHEVGHVAALHNVQGMQRQMGAQLMIELAGMAVGPEYQRTAEIATKVTTTMVNLRYSRKQEYEADKLGLRYMTAAGYNPWGMAELLRHLQEASGRGGGSLTEMFQTHPLTSNRIEEVSELIRQQYPDAIEPAPGMSDQFRQMKSLLPAG